jgi:thiamine kinase-like enzyme
MTIASWPDFPKHLSQTDVIIAPEILISLINKNTQRINQVQKVNAETRNPVYRLWLAGETSAVIVKWFLPELDQFYDSRYRREEKILYLLNKWFSRRVPQLYGGLITGNFAVIVEQDVGRQTLACMLDNTEDEAEKFDIALQGLEILADFHRICQTHYTVFYRTCYSTNLDRLTIKTYLRRARIAMGRLLLLQDVLQNRLAADEADKKNAGQLEALATARLGDKFFEWFAGQVVIPLMHAPRQIVHNSFSPYHLLWSDHWSLIDFETMSVGAAQIDLAEFVGAPEATFSTERQLSLAEIYYELRDDTRRPSWPDFVANYFNALAARSLDYVGTTAFRYIKYMAQQQEERALFNLNRARTYRVNVIEALKRNQGNGLADSIPQI